MGAQIERDFGFLPPCLTKPERLERRLPRVEPNPRSNHFLGRTFNSPTSPSHASDMPLLIHAFSIAPLQAPDDFPLMPHRIHMNCRVRIVTLAAALIPAAASALDCPPPLQPSKSEWEAEVAAAVGRIGPVKGAELAVKAKSATLSLLDRLPEANKVLLEQMMYSTHCSAIRDDRSTSELEKAALIRIYNREVRATLQQHVNASTRTSGGKPPLSASPVKKPAPVESPNPASVPQAGLPPPTRIKWDATLPLAMTSSGPTSLWQGRATQDWEVSLSLGELYELAFPFLAAWPENASFRSSIAGVIGEKYAQSHGHISDGTNHTLKESSFNALAIALRANELAKAEYLRTTTGSSALFWSEPSSGRKLLESALAANRAAREKAEANRQRMSTDPVLDKQIEDELQRRLQLALQQREAVHQKRIAELEQRLAGSVTQLNTMELPRKQSKFYVEAGQIWRRPDGKLMTVESVDDRELKLRSAGVTKNLKLTDEWSYGGWSDGCTVTVAGLERSRAIVDHRCR